MGDCTMSSRTTGCYTDKDVSTVLSDVRSIDRYCVQAHLSGYPLVMQLLNYYEGVSCGGPLPRVKETYA